MDDKEFPLKYMFSSWFLIF